MNTLLVVGIVGIVINYIILSQLIKESPEGAMGAGIALALGVIPYAILVILALDYLDNHLSGDE